MGSRLSENPENIFDVFLEIARPTDGEDPFILQKFPEDYDNEDVLKSTPKFAFPCEVESTQVDHFSFVLTDIEGRFKFGFCRHGVHGSGTCLVIVGQLPWFEIFYKLLNDLAETLNHAENSDIMPLLTTIYEMEPGELTVLQRLEVVTPDLTHKFDFVVPDPKQLPSIPENRNLTEYYGAVDVQNMMIIFASMLFERRILITSRKLSRLTACVHGSASLIYPMYWQHLYIPVLPNNLIDYCSAPMPFLIGIHSTLMQKVKIMELGDAVILDADANTVTTEYDDLQSLPEDIVNNLKKKLRNLQVDRLKHSVVGDGVARAFLRALVSLIGGYRVGLKFRAGEQITFDADSFIQSRPANLRPFLEQMMHLQTFEQFIKDRLDLLNDGTGFTDEFESEANMHADKSNAQSKYKEWSGQMVRQGRKLKKELREGKDRMAEFTHKVKDKSKKAYKDIRSRLDDKQRKEDSPNSSFSPLGGTMDIRRARGGEEPPRPPPPSKVTGVGPKVPSNAKGLYDRSSRQYKILTMDGLDSPLDTAAFARRHSSQDDSEINDFRLDRLSSLMDDPVIQNMVKPVKRSYSSEDVIRLEEEEIDEADEAEESMGYAALDEDPNGDLTTVTRTDETTEKQVVKSVVKDRSRSPTPSSGCLTPLMSRPRPKSPAAGSTSSGEAVLPPPQAPPRRRQDMQQREQELIRLNSGDGGDGDGDDLNGPGGLKANDISTLDSFRSLTPSELAAQNEVTLEDIRKQGEESPRIRASVSRQPAFYKKRTSLATDARTTIREARSAFIQEGNASNHVYDMFDPLKSGRVALDVPQPCGPETDKLSGNSDGSQEENLLKEWNLDFSNKMRVTNNKGSPFRNDPLNMYAGLKVAGNRQSQCLDPSPSMSPQRPSRPVSMYGQPLRFNHPVNTPAPLPAGLASVPAGLNNNNFGGSLSNTTPRRTNARSPSAGQPMGGHALGGAFKTSPLSSAYSSDFNNKSLAGSTSGFLNNATHGQKKPPPVPQKPTWMPKKPMKTQPPNSNVFDDLDPLKNMPSMSPSPQEIPAPEPSQSTNSNTPTWETFD